MLNLTEILDAPTDEERMIADSAAAFHGHGADLKRVRAQRQKAPGYCVDTWRQMAELGWTGLNLPEAYGGSEGAFGQFMVLAEHMGRALAPEPLVPAALLAGGVVAHGDNDALKDTLLPAVAGGKRTLALAWQEPGRGQDAAPEQTTAVSRDGAMVLNGSKCFVPVGEGADAFIVSAQADGGVGLYLVEKGDAGLELTTRARIDGGFWTDVTLHDVRVPAERVVASPAIGASVLARGLDEARMGASAELLGIMSRAFEISVEYIKTREQFGQPVGSFQALQHRAVDQLIQIELARAVVLQNTRFFELTADLDERAMAASQTKARCSDAALKVTKSCIQLHGGIGYTEEADIGLFLKRALVLAAWLGGADESRQRYAELKARGVTTDMPEEVDDEMAEVSAWLDANFPQDMRFPDHRLDGTTTAGWHKKLHAKGWVAPSWPKEYGGMGLSAYQQVRFQEACDRIGMNITPNMGVAMLGPLLIRYGSEAQKREHLPKILSGEVRWCQGYSEPGAGSDLANVRTSAVLDGDEFVVNGQKIWTSLAYEAQKIFMLVRTDPAAKKQNGISFLLVDMDTPGITVRRIVNLTGSGEFCEVFFDNVRVPKDNLVGRLNEGWKMAKSLLGSERIMIGSPRLAKYPLGLLAGYARHHGLDKDPSFMARLTQLELDIEDQGASFVRMMEALRRGRELGAEVSMLKIWITETFQRVTDLIIETLGETATLDESVPVGEGRRMHASNLYMSSRPATIYGGSSEIQRNILAKMVLQLPGA